MTDQRFFLATATFSHCNSRVRVSEAIVSRHELLVSDKALHHYKLFSIKWVTEELGGQLPNFYSSNLWLSSAAFFGKTVSPLAWFGGFWANFPVQKCSAVSKIQTITLFWLTLTRYMESRVCHVELNNLFVKTSRRPPGLWVLVTSPGDLTLPFAQTQKRQLQGFDRGRWEWSWTCHGKLKNVLCCKKHIHTYQITSFRESIGIC